jgi:hypothetical protein
MVTVENFYDDGLRCPVLKFSHCRPILVGVRVFFGGNATQEAAF